MNRALSGNYARFDLGFGLMPGLPLAAGVRPVLDAILIFDAVDHVIAFDASSGFIESEVQVIEQNGHGLMLSCLDGIGRVAESNRVCGKRSLTPNVRRGERWDEQDKHGSRWNEKWTSHAHLDGEKSKHQQKVGCTPSLIRKEGAAVPALDLADNITVVT